jgi:hypothetical protein
MRGIAAGSGPLGTCAEGAACNGSRTSRPFLDEVARVKAELMFTDQDAEVPQLQVIAVDPDDKDAATKMQSLKLNVGTGENVVSTHALFALVDDEAAEAFKRWRYTLIIDEVTDWVRELPSPRRTLRRCWRPGGSPSRSTRSASYGTTPRSRASCST